MVQLEKDEKTRSVLRQEPEKINKVDHQAEKSTNKIY